jgi:hypothetical protein
MCCCAKDFTIYWAIKKKIDQGIKITKKEYNFLMKNNFPFKEIPVEE